jgi:hypothetical protein
MVDLYLQSSRIHHGAVLNYLRIGTTLSLPYFSLGACQIITTTATRSSGEGCEGGGGLYRYLIPVECLRKT